MHVVAVLQLRGTLLFLYQFCSRSWLILSFYYIIIKFLI